MCIRDRARRAGEVRRRVDRRLAGRDREGRGPAEVQDRDGDCLLYTSDAADERSSVDLGGRRIIKKKKKTREESTRTYKHKLNSKTHMTSE